MTYISGQWPTFHGPVILSYILKTFWWRNVLLKILILCDIKFDYKHILIYMVQWFCLICSILFDEQASFFGYWFSMLWATVFHDLAILNHLPISACSGYENISECNKVRNRPVVYSRREVGSSVYFGHISSFLHIMLEVKLQKMMYKMFE